MWSQGRGAVASSATSGEVEEESWELYVRKKRKKQPIETFSFSLVSNVLTTAPILYSTLVRITFELTSSSRFLLKLSYFCSFTVGRGIP